MTTALMEDALTETYNDVHALIRHTVGKFIQANGTRWGNFDDLFSLANEQFMTAWRHYKRPDGNRECDSSFSTWCRWVVQKGLLEHQRNIIRRDRICRISVKDTTEMQVPDASNPCRLTDLFDEMTPDARIVAEIALNPPGGLAECIREVRGNSPRNIQAVIRQYLYGLDWSVDRVNEAFDQLGEVLQ